MILILLYIYLWKIVVEKIYKSNFIWHPVKIVHALRTRSINDKLLCPSKPMEYWLIIHYYFYFCFTYFNNVFYTVVNLHYNTNVSKFVIKLEKYKIILVSNMQGDIDDWFSLLNDTIYLNTLCVLVN